MMRYVIVDLEATCWEKGTRPDRQYHNRSVLFRFELP